MKSTQKVKDCEFLTIRLKPQKYAELKLVAQSLGTSSAAYARQALFEKLIARNQHPQQYQQAD